MFTDDGDPPGDQVGKSSDPDHAAEELQEVEFLPNSAPTDIRNGQVEQDVTGPHDVKEQLR